MLLGLLMLLFAHSVQAEDASLIVNVGALRNSQGSVNALLFDREDGYPGDASQAVRNVVVPISNGQARFVMLNLPTTPFVVALFHDENNNGKLDRYWYGKPMEGIGVSNNVHNSFGPPEFTQSMVQLVAGKTEINIAIVYK